MEIKGLLVNKTFGFTFLTSLSSIIKLVFTFLNYLSSFSNARVCERDITIKGYKFLKGMTIQVPVFGLARDPNYWDEPEKYIPDRLLLLNISRLFYMFCFYKQFQNLKIYFILGNNVQNYIKSKFLQRVFSKVYILK